MSEEKRIKKGKLSYDEANAFENALRQFDCAARILNLDDNQIAMIKQPRRVTWVKLPIRMDDGTIKVFDGFRVQHNIASTQTEKFL